MSWYRVVLENGKPVSCDLVDDQTGSSTDVFYVEADSPELATKVALLLAARRRKRRRGPTRKESEAQLPPANTSRLETLEEVAQAWQASETQAQFVRWLVSEISKLKGPILPAETGAPQSSLSGVSF